MFGEKIAILIALRSTMDFSTEKKEWVECLTSQKTHKFCGEREVSINHVALEEERKNKGFLWFFALIRKSELLFFISLFYGLGVLERDLWNNWTYNDNYINFYKFVVTFAKLQIYLEFTLKWPFLIAFLLVADFIGKRSHNIEYFMTLSYLKSYFEVWFLNRSILTRFMVNT